jgi:sulfide:quinone oxidoreductase
VNVRVVSASDKFLYTPSLIWLPFGKRDDQDITFPLQETLDREGVDFVHGEATALDLPNRRVETSAGSYEYDYLVIATGYRNDYSVIDGLGPDGHSQNITSLPDAIRAGEAWTKFRDAPGPVVIGATQGAGCFGAAYEYLFNFSYQLKKAGLADRAPLTYISPEPFLGHFGVGGLPHGEQLLGMFLKKEHISHHLDVGIESIDDGRVTMNDGTTHDFAYAMIVPPFVGQDVIRDTPEISDAKGYVQVRDTYQTMVYDNVYAVGIAAAVTVPWHTSNAVGIPKTGFPTETMAKVAAHNIESQIRGDQPEEHKEFGDIAAICVMDAGNNGVVILGDKMLPPRKHGVLVPGPHAHAMKLAFEKYFLWKMRHGHVSLP